MNSQYPFSSHPAGDLRPEASPWQQASPMPRPVRAPHPAISDDGLIGEQAKASLTTGKLAILQPPAEARWRGWQCAAALCFPVLPAALALFAFATMMDAAPEREARR
jgi:hypothetical protein